MSVSWRILEGDCRELLATLPDESVDAVVTDPPYGLEFMGKEWDRFRVDDPGTARHRGERAGGHGEIQERDGSSVQGRMRTVFGGGKRATTHRCAQCGKRDQFRNPHEPCGDGEWRQELIDPHAAPPTMLAFQEWSRQWALEAKRVLKPGGHLLAFGGTRTYHRLACAIEDAGFEIRDCIAWMYGSGFPKSLDVSKAIDKAARRQYVAAALDLGLNVPSNSLHDWTVAEHAPSDVWWERFKAHLSADDWQRLARAVIGRDNKGDAIFGNAHGEYDITAPATPEAQQWQGWGTALKPAHEPIVVARKPLAGTVSQTVLAHGTGALNVDGCRIGTDAGWSYPNGRGGEGWHGRESLSSNLDEPLEAQAGRWPANVVLDEEAAAMLDEQSGTLKSGGGIFRRNADKFRNTYGTFEGTAEVDLGPGSEGGASRFFYCAKASRAERNAGLEGFAAQKVNRYGAKGQGPLPQQTPTEGVIERNTHPTVKPIALMCWLVRLVTPPGGVVLDPFAGSGTTGIAALREGFSFVGIEREAEYAEIASARIAWWAAHPEGMDLAARLEAEAERKATADRGQLELLDESAA